MKHGRRISTFTFFAVIILYMSVASCPGKARADEKNPEGEVADRYGLAAILGNSYDPTNDIDFFMISGVALYDYDRIWPHRAPEPLRFRVELSAGGTTVDGSTRLIASFGVLAEYYLNSLSSDRCRPYVEAGIGAIYTDFQVEGQGFAAEFQSSNRFWHRNQKRFRDIVFYGYTAPSCIKWGFS